MNKKIKLLILLLSVALCAVSISFHCNHRRLKEKNLKLIAEVNARENSRNFSKDEVETIRTVLGDDFSKAFSVNRVVLDGQNFVFCDLVTSDTVNMVANEIGHDIYDFSTIDFKEGDVVIDIGGNVGMISIFLAKKFPFLKIYAFEPVRENFENFKRNIKLNSIPDGIITVENLAVTKDGRDITMHVNTLNSGGSNMFGVTLSEDLKISEIHENGIHSVTLDNIFKSNGIKACKLLKIDCEGAEYEILYNVNKDTLRRCQYLRGEFHETPKIRACGYFADELERYCSTIVNNVAVVFNGTAEEIGEAL